MATEESCLDSNLGRWLISQSGSYAGSLCFVPESSGQAIWTGEDIEAGVCLAFCPFSLTITPQSSRAALRRIVGETADLLDDHKAMCLYLALHKLSPASPLLNHAAYVASLPEPSRMGTAMYFTREERLLLRGTNLDGAVRDREALWTDESIDMARRIGQDIPYELWLWCCTILSSRAFPSSLIPGSAGESTPVLFPGVDAFNHRRGEKVSWHSTSSGLELRTDVPLANGRQVFNNYGAKSNEEWLLGYGFVLPENPEDAIAVKLGYPTSTDTDWAQRLLDAGLTANLRHLIGRDGRIPDTLLKQMRVFLDDGQDDIELELDVLDQLCQMLSSKLHGLDMDTADLLTSTNSDTNDPSGAIPLVRPEVARMCEIYRKGQVDCARAALVEAERLWEKALELAKEAGITFDD